MSSSTADAYVNDLFSQLATLMGSVPDAQTAQNNIKDLVSKMVEDTRRASLEEMNSQLDGENSLRQAAIDEAMTRAARLEQTAAARAAEASAAALKAQNAALENDMLRDANAVLQSAADARPAVPPRRHGIRPAAPTPFAGDKKSQDLVESFIDACEEAFLFEDGLTDAQKISWTAGFFQTGQPASSWIRPYLGQVQRGQYDADAPTWIMTWVSFVDEMKRRFGNPFAMEDDYDALLRLSQLESARDYIVRFNRLVAGLGMPDHLQIMTFRRNLKGDVKRALAGRTFPTLEQLANAVVQIDEDLFPRATYYYRNRPRSRPRHWCCSSTRTYCWSLESNAGSSICLPANYSSHWSQQDALPIDSGVDCCQATGSLLWTQRRT